MSAVIAKGPGGFCTCGTQIDRGEQILLRPTGAIHVGCPERAPASSGAKTTVTKTESSGFLFSEMEVSQIETARQTVGATRIVFDGPTCLGIDTPRLAGQLTRVFTLMADGKFRTLNVIASLAGCLETSASARLRDFRKSRFGGHTVVSRQIADSPREYRLIVKTKGEGNERSNAA